MKRILLLAAGCSLFCACSLRRSTELPDPLSIRVKTAPRGAMDPEITRNSRAMYHYLVGQLSFADQDFSGALEHLEKAETMISQPSPGLHSRLAELYIRQGELEKALEINQKALDEDPENLSTQLLQAGILEALGRAADAEPIYLKLISQHPDQVNAAILLSGLYTNTGQFDKAIAVLEKLTKTAPKEAVGYFYLGRVYERLGKEAKAEGYYKTALQRSPDNMAASVDLMRVYLKQQKLGDAKSLCQKVLEKDQDNVVARRVMGELLIGENRLDEALNHLRVL